MSKTVQIGPSGGSGGGGSGFTIAGNGLKSSGVTVSLNDGYANGSQFLYTNSTWNNFGVLQGTDLTDADQTLTIAGGMQYFLQSGVLTNARAKTLSTAGATTGAVITVVRFGTGANAMTIVNGGAGAGTMYTFPGSSQYPIIAHFRFDGTNWSLVSWQFCSALVNV